MEIREFNPGGGGGRGPQGVRCRRGTELGEQLRELDEDSVVFIDEGNRFVSSRRFQK